jgi:NRPS condensation-like uncharacterized protein
MHQWSDLHPYNAFHAYRIARPLCAERLREAMRQAYCQSGLGFVEVNADGRSYRYEVDPSPPLEVLDGGHDLQTVLRELFARELNGPFARPRCRPLRVSAVAAGPADHYVCVGYDHWASDSVAARLIMRRVLDRYLDLNLPANQQPLTLYPETYRKAFAQRMSPLRLVRGVMQVAGQLLWRRTICQVPYTSVTHMPVGYAFSATADGTADRLRHFARSLGATVHDVILAALGRAMAEHLPRRVSRDGTCPMAIGTIVDTRGDSTIDLSDTLGAFLSYYAVRFAAERDAGLAQLTRRVAALTGPIKARRAYLDAVPQMKLFSMVWPLLSPWRRPHYARRVLPMTAGVSNVVMRDTWIDMPGSPIVDYLRGAPTGPMLPLAVTATTLGSRMNLGITYRQTGFTEARLDGILAMLQEQLEHPDRTNAGRRPTPSLEAEPTPERHSVAA